MRRFFTIAAALLFLGWSILLGFAQTAPPAPVWKPPPGSIDAIIKRAPPEMMDTYSAFRKAWKDKDIEKAEALSESVIVMAKRYFGEESLLLPLIYMDVGNFYLEFSRPRDKQGVSIDDALSKNMHLMEQAILIWFKTGTGTTAAAVLSISLAELYIDEGRYEEAVALFSVPQFKPDFLAPIYFETEELLDEASRRMDGEDSSGYSNGYGTVMRTAAYEEARGRLEIAEKLKRYAEFIRKSEDEALSRR